MVYLISNSVTGKMDWPKGSELECQCNSGLLTGKQNAQNIYDSQNVSNNAGS